MKQDSLKPMIEALKMFIPSNIFDTAEGLVTILK